MKIHSNFDGGNIRCLSANDPMNIQLEICPEPSGHFQWFFFRVTGEPGTTTQMHIQNAGNASYAKAWTNAQAVVSTDQQEWLRAQTSYQDGVLTITHTLTHPITWFAYFAPYSLQRHAELLGRVQQVEGVAIDVLGESVDGRTIDRIRIGDGPWCCWIIARHHPGETMGPWCVEGLLERLLDPTDDTARALRARANFHIIPNINPDGGFRGHLRTNAAGMDLNRAWLAPTAEHTPEVFVTRNAMDQTGVDLCLDIHGDEILHYCFGAAGLLGVPALTDAQRSRFLAFQDAMIDACPDFQTEQGYPIPEPKAANLSLCANQVAERFNAIAMTIEQPFQDNCLAPNPTTGWSPQRSKQLGAEMLDAILSVCPK